MQPRILVLDGHPDPSGDRFVHALAEAYASAARESGHEVRVRKLAQIKYPLLASNSDYLTGVAPDVVLEAQTDLTWCNHLAVFYPLWLGSMPALLKGFFEQVLRPGFAFGPAGRSRLPKKLLAGRSVRIVVTMGMPALFYKWVYRAHSLKSLERNILGFVGFKPIRTTLIGSVESSAAHRVRWLGTARKLGAAGK